MSRWKLALCVLLGVGTCGGLAKLVDETQTEAEWRAELRAREAYWLQANCDARAEDRQRDTGQARAASHGDTRQAWQVQGAGNADANGYYVAVGEHDGETTFLNDQGWWLWQDGSQKLWLLGPVFDRDPHYSARNARDSRTKWSVIPGEKHKAPAPRVVLND
jgi:hypothetical protein